jgi:4-aminobutyrate aminotransferase-like enzyme
VPPDGFLRGLRDLCDAHGVLLILDEIFTGLGRTGRQFACNHEGVVPDLLCIGKALGGGFPLSACLGLPHVMASWGEARGEALHTSTFLGHPVACAAALATLAVMHDEGIAARAKQLGSLLLAELRAGLTSPWVAEVRGRGLLLGVELHDPDTKQPAPRVVWRTVVEAMRRGILVLPCGVHGHVLQLTPPAVLTEAQRGALVEGLIGAVHAAIAAERIR